MTGTESMAAPLAASLPPGAAPASFDAAGAAEAPGYRGEHFAAGQLAVLFRSERFQFDLVEHPGQYPVKVWREQP